jgi:23S rRNA pseudouridine2605 synthase
MKKEIEKIRLNKFISHNSSYSRREADKLIEDKRVSINKDIITDLSTKVSNSDIVCIDKKPIKYERNKIYTVIVYNKPKGQIVSKSDPQGRTIIFDTLHKEFKDFLPIGRLDYSSEGLLLLTNSVDVYNSLVHSSLERVYKIKLNGAISKLCEDAMKNGIFLEDATKGAREDSKIKSMNFKPFNAYQIQSITNNYTKLKVSISQGQNRELRRFFAHFDLDVLDLKRLEFGGISLNNLPTAKSRYFTKKEYENLKEYIKENKKI